MRILSYEYELHEELLKEMHKISNHELYLDKLLKEMHNIRNHEL